MGTLRITFTTEDLGRVRIAAGPDAMWEVVLSFIKLQNRDTFQAFSGWRRSVAGSVGPWLHVLRPIVPIGAYFADFMTPPQGVQGIEAGLDAMVRTPARQLNREVHLLAENGPLPAWSHDLAAGRAETMKALGATVRRYYDTVLGPCWPRVTQSVDRDRGRRVAALASGGSDAMFASFRPMMRWDPPVLETDYCVDQELQLDGRGLLLVPSFFCWGSPVTLVDPALPPVLVYPVERTLDFAADGWPAGDGAAGRDPLAALLGGTRAGVLRALQHSATTTDLARRVGISLASASQHATVLRNAGLVETQRAGSAVRHSLTDLGRQVVASLPAAAVG